MSAEAAGKSALLAGDVVGCMRTSPPNNLESMGDSIQSPGDASLNAIGRHEYEFGMRTMAPPLAELLSSSGCHLFLDAMRNAGRLEGANSITILAPNDNAFLSGACLCVCASLYGMYVTRDT